MTFHYGMKAAPLFPGQIRNRVQSFQRLGLPKVIELHLFGLADVFADLGPLLSGINRFIGECRFIVHYPIMDVRTGYLFDAFGDHEEKLKKVLEFTKAVGGRELVMHCCYGFNSDMSKGDAMTGFLEKLGRWNDLAEAHGVRILLENYGFVWLPKGMGAEFVVSPLDHLFPWDREYIVGVTKSKGMGAVGFLLDTAHAVLSSNMFNMRKKHKELEGDLRFRNVYPEDLERRGFLSPENFVGEDIEYFHVSDAFVWRGEDGLKDLGRWLCKENLPIGKGNVDFEKIMAKAKGNETVIMEIDPEDGDHENNLSQYEAVVRFREKFG